MRIEKWHRRMDGYKMGWALPSRHVGWAVPSRREIQECRKSGGKNVLDFCKTPKGWRKLYDVEDSDDGGNPGRYIIRFL